MSLNGPVDRRVTDFIQRNHDTYTEEVIRRALLRQRYDAADIDAGFHAVESGTAPPVSSAPWRFWPWLIGSVVLVYGLVFLAFLFGSRMGIFRGIGQAILFVLLLLAAVLSFLLARRNRAAAMGVRSAIVTAFLMPLVFVVLIAGACTAIVGPPFWHLIPAERPSDATMAWCQDNVTNVGILVAYQYIQPPEAEAATPETYQAAFVAAHPNTYYRACQQAYDYARPVEP